jgi:hypothetical protein
MSNKVFANGRELSCQAGNGKSIACFPDVCFTPPDKTPATPLGVPIPYPNFGYSSDTTKGSKTVKVSGKEVMLRNKSYFKKSTGDEAAKPTQKKGLLTTTVQGKVFFASWSPDVKIETENVVRHLDMTTHNHACTNANALTMPHQVSAALSVPECAAQEAEAQTACQDATVRPRRRLPSGGLVDDGLDCDDDCKAAKACVLRPKSADGTFCCHPDITGHHLIEVHCFTHPGGRSGGETLLGYGNYDAEAAPCVCASTASDSGSHGILHSVQGKLERAYGSARKNAPLDSWGSGPDEASYWNYEEARNAGAQAHKLAFPDCDEECIKKALDAYHQNQCGIGSDDSLRSDLTVRRREMQLGPSQQSSVIRTIKQIFRIARPS